MDKLLIIIGLIFFIAGGIGLLLTNNNLNSGDIQLILGNVTFGTFIVVGLVLIITMIVASWESY
ncbi:hypothetical protein ACFLRP_04985 [Bacteroidota bacterium]